uniref:Hepcidin antimicrobial peptide n=1 Tax=Chinchilla lanigera TaxID=34839 RepID=A0A8C2W3C5_CHILA
MALNTQIRAACLLVLLLASLTSGSIVQSQTGQLADLPSHDTAEAKASFMVRAIETPALDPRACPLPPAHSLSPFSQPTLQRLRKRDTHFPICIFCCGCCKNVKCGICCKT